MKGVLQGLETMHAQNYMHRDLKPENILFREGSNECVIADFGLAEAAGSELMFVRCGTPGYVAPEIVNLKSSKASYTTACDLFSLGVIFHLMVLGKSPFPGKTFDEVLEQNKSCRINFETFEYNQLPTSCNLTSYLGLSLLKGLLEKDPKKRLTATQALGH
jgi:calcium-dependent protein kinase